MNSKTNAGATDDVDQSLEYAVTNPLPRQRWASGEMRRPALLPLQANGFLIMPCVLFYLMESGWDAHLNRDEIESSLSVSGIQGCHDIALIKSFEMSPQSGRES